MSLRPSPVARTLSAHTFSTLVSCKSRSIVTTISRVASPGIIALLLGAALVFGASGAGRAAPLTNLHNFSYQQFGGGGDGNTPNTLLLSGTTLYGTTDTGGEFDDGTIFKISTNGTGFQVLYNFGAAAADGTEPGGSLVLIGSTLYGVTYAGGTDDLSGTIYDPSAGYGTVYKINTDGTGYEILYSFGAKTGDGHDPIGGLVVSGSTLYGETYYGGANLGPEALGGGTVYKINTDGTGYSILYSFAASSTDGAYPDSPLLLSGSELYGTATQGGTHVTSQGTGAGTIFKIATSGSGYATVYNFGASATDGYEPESGLTLVGSTLWGTTLFGGASNEGTLYEIGTSGSAYSLVHAFGGSVADGVYPRSGVTLVGSTLYGTTDYGGGTSSDNGTLYGISTSATSYQTDYSYGTVDGDGEDASIPYLAEGSGVFYGVMAKGGISGNGTVYSLNIGGTAPTWTAQAIAAGPNGTSMELWTRSDGAAGLWALDATDHVSAIGSIYGPYVDSVGAWTAKAVATASDGTSRVLWTRSDGAAGLWSFDANGDETQIGGVYGPFSGWSAKSVGVSGDGTSRILWSNTNGMAGVWVMDKNDLESYIGQTYGPYAGGYVAKSLATDDSGNSRVLWVAGNGAAGLWTMDPLGTEVLVGPTYSAPAGFSATAVGATDIFSLEGANTAGNATLLWTSSSSSGGSSMLWLFDGTNTATVKGPTYGPYSGFTPTSLSTSDSDGSSRVLWNESNGAAGIWTFGTDTAENIIGQVYGPF